MRTIRLALGTCLVAAMVPHAATGQSPPAVSGPVFDVVSVKPNVTPPTITPGGPGPMGINPRPDGGLTMTRVPVTLVLALAYQPMSTADMVGLPDWASREFYDVTATASLKNPSVDDRMAMVRAMLADRFRLVVHRERREVPSSDMVLARNDGKLGPGLSRTETDCNAVMAARRKEAEDIMRAGTPPPPPQRFDPDSPPPSDDTPSVFTALREQLGLRLEPSRTERDVLVIDRLERPTEN